MTDASKPKPMSAAAKQEELRRARTIALSLVAAVVFALVNAVVYTRSAQLATLDYLTFSLLGVAALASLISAWLARRKQTTPASIVLTATILITALDIPFIIHGQGIAAGILIAIIGMGVSSFVLTKKQVNRGAVLSIVSGGVVVVVDQIMPTFGMEPNSVYTNAASMLAALIFIGVLVRRFNSFALRTKMVVAFTAVTLIPLFILGVYNNYASSQILSQESRARLTDLSSTTAEQFDSFFLQQMSEIHIEASQIALVDYLTLAPQNRAGSVAESNAKTTLFSFQNKDSVFIDSYAILDIKGDNILSTNAEDLGRSEGKETYFVEAIRTGAPYASNALFIEAGQQSVYFSAPIKNASGKIVGVLRAEYNAIIMQSMARASASKSSEIAVAVVDRNTYLRLAYTGNRDEIFKSYKNFTDAEVAAFQAERKMPPGAPSEILAGADNVVATGIDNIVAAPFFDAYSDSLKSNAINTGALLKSQPWVVITRESYASSLAAVHRQTENAVLISVALAIIAALLALGSVQFLVAPIVSLTKVAQQITEGDVGARATIHSQDEIGSLAASFNLMADELNQALNSLEVRVAERTIAIENIQIQSEKRANELEAISEISKVITGEQKLANLLPLITRLVSERFGFYHTGIFLLDETKQYAVLQAANSEGGRKMLARGHKLEVGASGIVGYVAHAGVHRIALDVGMDAVFFNNPDLPTTRSEMALPLKIRNTIVGALDVQSEKSNAFTENDAKNLSILADQISIALENARLFTRTQQALSEAQALYRQNIQEGWAAFTREESSLGYRQNMKGGTELFEPVETAEIREAVSRGSVSLFHADGVAQEPTIVVPIKLRGQVIGSLNITAPSRDRQWTRDEINLTEVVSERLSIALENARLIQDSQRQAIKQQTISEVTERIGASINLKNVLQTAVEELGRAMPGSEVVLQLKSDSS